MKQDGSLPWLEAGAVRANQDNTDTDQWNPSIAISPDGNTLFIGYYSRHERPTENDLIRAYGVKADISNGLENATFEMFPISPTSFPPLFAGPISVTSPCNFWLYDPVFPQEGMCVDVYAEIMPCPTPPPGEPQVPPQYCNQGAFELKTGFEHIHFMADDYTWAAADDNGDYFYFAWCDRSRSCSLAGGTHTRPDPNVRLARIRY